MACRLVLNIARKFCINCKFCKARPCQLTSVDGWLVKSHVLIELDLIGLAKIRKFISLTSFSTAHSHTDSSTEDRTLRQVYELQSIVSLLICIVLLILKHKYLEASA